MPLSTAKLRAKVIERAPMALLTNAHEIALAVGLFFFALPLIATDSPPRISTAAIWPLLVAISGVATVYGVVKHKARFEWAGQLITGWTLAFYAFFVILDHGGYSAAVWILFAVASWWKAFRISSAVLVQKRLSRERIKVTQETLDAREEGGDHE